MQRDRLLGRDPDAAPEVLERRLEEADAEEALAGQFDAVVVNDDPDRAVHEIQTLLDRERRRA